MPRLVQVAVTVKIPDDVNVEDYLNEVSFDCIHPTDGDIYERIAENGYEVIGSTE